jgi:hypothetical protein
MSGGPSRAAPPSRAPYVRPDFAIVSQASIQRHATVTICQLPWPRVWDRVQPVTAVPVYETESIPKGGPVLVENPV